MSESARQFALQITDILEEIVEHLAPGKECTSGDQQQDVSALTRVSKAFHIPATNALWARLPSLHPLLLLLPEYDRLYQAHCKDKPFNRLTSVRLSEPISPEIWARFRDRAVLVRRLAAGYDTLSISRLARQTLARLSSLDGGAGPLLPSLQAIISWRSMETCEDLVPLASPLLRVLSLRHVGTEDDDRADGDYAEDDESGSIGEAKIDLDEAQHDNVDQWPLTIQNMFANAPGLTKLDLNDSNGELFARVAPEAFYQLRTLRFFVNQASDMAPDELYPTAEALRALSTLPVLQHLRMELDVDRYDLEFVGFPSLAELAIVDCGRGDTAWFLTRCSSPHLHTLTINLTNLYFHLFRWEHLLPLCSAIAGSAPQLCDLSLSFRHFHSSPELSPDMLLTAARPLLALRDLTDLSLWFDHGEIILSDAVLESFAEAWPALVSLRICFRMLRQSVRPGAPPIECPITVTLRCFRAFARHCPHLKSLHIPHLYVTVDDCADDTDGDGSEHAPDHRLLELAVCRAYIDIMESGARWCAWALNRIFPHLDVNGSRDLYVRRSHSGQHLLRENIRADEPFVEAWLSMLDALEGYQTFVPDVPESSSLDDLQCDSSGE
ncbi:uncharacterized protein TRAVEDRAFT_52073 [Trametes versicolor FP-101664 SS1]|uniref:uncharacterized protein n=1 Tax=Trametes versicolor (strain FP-101664) TaxID=717944 RepID=UPI000462259E|nr:uncharacterized protein TRAVEDRAFT_52073 [Trametes versicolor FP-101664 SS1]EIW54366.1 hypothetical protein TRAVEDRAFT_52073 [Trametes versicolor FP-101664 SS1]